MAMVDCHLINGSDVAPDVSKDFVKLHQMFKNILFKPSYMSTKTLLLLPCSQKQV